MGLLHLCEHVTESIVIKILSVTAPLEELLDIEGEFELVLNDVYDHRLLDESGPVRLTSQGHERVH